MPIHDLGYRTWDGRLTPDISRFWVVAQTGIRLAWKNRWLRRLLPIAWLPAVYMGIAFFLLEQGLAHQEELKELGSSGQAELRVVWGFLSQFPEAEYILEKVAAGDAAEARQHAWAWLLWTFFRYPQGLLMVLVVGLVAPPLVAKDVHSRAFVLYFSRPLIRVEYILGKLAVVCAYVLLITTVPALVLYLMGVLFSPDATLVLSTWGLSLRILLASGALILPTAALALAFSSMTTKTPYAGFAWFAVWFLGMVAYGTVTSMPYAVSDHWSLLSLYHTLGKVQSWVFGLPVVSGQEPSFGDALPSAVLLAAVTVVSMIVVFRRVSSPMRI